MTVCLDSWTVLRWLEGIEPAAGRVESLLQDRPVMSWINLGEVYHVLARRVDEVAARSMVTELRRQLTLDLPSAERVLQAASIKGRYPLPYADAFAVATSSAHEAVLLTGDPEIIDAGGSWAVEDLRG